MVEGSLEKIEKLGETLVSFRSYPPPYYQPKSKCVLNINDSKWLETQFKYVFD